MASTHRFEVNRTTSADPETLYEMVSNGPRWKEWGKPIAAFSGWAKPGSPAPNDVGAVRWIGLPLIRERTIEAEHGRRHVYTMAMPAPMRDYRGEVLFTPGASGGTELRWQGTFTERVPGTGAPLAKALQKLIGALVDRLVRAAERQA